MSSQFKVEGTILSVVPSKSGAGLNVWVDLGEGEKVRLYAGKFSKASLQGAVPGQPITTTGKLKCTPKTLPSGTEVVDHALFVNKVSLGPAPSTSAVLTKEADEELPW